MRRIALSVSLLLVFALAPSGAQAGGEQEFQFVSGNIKMLTRFTDADGGFPGAGRRLWNAAHETNGLISYTFAVEPETVLGRFELTVTREGGAGLGDPFEPADLGIYFYSDLADAGNSAAVTTAEYDRRTPGGETGFIAPDSRYAIVFMSRGFDVDLTYKAWTPMTIDATDTGFSPADVTVGRGAWIVFHNTGQDFHGATADNGAFNTSPTEKHPLIPGAKKGFQLLTEGDFTFFDRFDGDENGPHTGVIHVVPGPGEGTPA